METALIAGFFAFIGAVAGQILNRNTQRETWLLQKRAEVFSKFLIDLTEFDRECPIFDNASKLPEEKHQAMSIACDRINTAENMVCFYLSESDKAEFRKLVNDRRYFEVDYKKITNHNDMNQYERLLAPWHELNDNIQKLFERNLEKVSWYD